MNSVVTIYLRIPVAIELGPKVSVVVYHEWSLFATKRLWSRKTAFKRTLPVNKLLELSLENSSDNADADCCPCHYSVRHYDWCTAAHNDCYYANRCCSRYPYGPLPVFYNLCCSYSYFACMHGHTILYLSIVAIASYTCKHDV